MSIMPQKLKKGDKVMVVAPSTGLKLIRQDCRDIATKRLEEMGLEVVFAKNTTDDNFDILGSTSPQKRAADINQAFADKSVKAVLTVLGGFNSNEILKYIDYDVIKANPKIFMGFSDITALHAAIYAKTGLVTYYGPHYSSLGMKKGCEYTLKNMQKMLFEGGEAELLPSVEWSDDAWYIDQENRDFLKNEGFWHIQKGSACGTIVGGNLCTFILNSGTPYFPKFEQDTILFIEDDAASKLPDFDRNLQALINREDFENVKGLVIGRFQKASDVTREKLEFILDKAELKNMPIIANIDMGHTTPIATIPLGGFARLENGRIFIEG